MTPAPRTPQQRDRRFARVRRLSQTLLLASGVVSALTIALIASAAKPYVAVPVRATNSTTPSTTIAPSNTATTTSPSTTQYTPPTTVPVTTTTACFSTPSGQVTCN